MITVQLKGGLGNQMFQYAFIRAKSLRDKKACALDRSFLDIKKANAGYTLRDFELNYFNIKAEVSRNWVLRVVFFLDRVLGKLKLGRLVHHEGSMRYNEKNIGSRACFFSGYFQCERYFNDYASEIRKDFEPLLPLCITSKDALESIGQHQKNAVSIHIRRGDYVTLAAAQSTHGSCSKEYYLEAMEMMKKKIPSPKFYFFSDDIDWVKKEFSFAPNAYFIEDEKNKKSFEDLVLMSKCHSHIVANSSYSWWGAWLNTNPEKMVIAPSRWFSSPELQYDDVIPSNWIKI